MHDAGGREIRSALKAALLVLGLTISTGVRADESRLSDYFGFLPLEIYKLDNRISNLLLADLDGDAINDIAVANNARSRIDLLLSGKKASEGQGPGRAKPGPNEVTNDHRMRLVSVPVNKEVVSLQTGDLNADGKPDLVFYGTPAELVVLLNQGGGEFREARRINSGDAIESGTALAVGDLNRDGKDDLALLESNELLLVYQDAKGQLREPERLPHTAGNPRMLRAVDLDGDGGHDLLILDGGNDDPVRVRFSAEGGTLGPEQRFLVEAPKAIALAPIDSRPGAELLTVETQSGRARIFTLDDADKDQDKTGRLIFYPLPPGNERGRSLALGDIDGDGKADVVVTDPADAQFLVYRQSGRSGLGASQSFPGLVGGKTVKLADLDGDRKCEVIVLSEQEKQVGLSRFASGRLTFPTPLPISGEPVALDVADLDGDKVPEVLYAVRVRPASADTSGRDSFVLHALRREASGTFLPFRWGPADEVALKGLLDAPPALRVLDVNRDGHADVLVFNASGSPLLLLGRAGEPPAPAGGTLGSLAGVTPAGLSLIDLNGPALVVAQKTFARNILLDKDGHWQVKDQYNTGRSSAEVIGVAALDVDGDGTKEVVLLDQSSKSLVFLTLKESVYRPGSTLSVGPIDFEGMHVADLDGDGRDDLLLAGTDRFAVLLTDRKGQRLKPLASYESSRTEARLADLAAGDLNADGRPDVVLTDIGEHFVDIVSYQPPDELEHAVAFRVFERKSMRNTGALVEPRDLAIGDVDGDHRDDLVLVVHDRILVYRQDPGKPGDDRGK
jgi:hypothetical protein